MPHLAAQSIRRAKRLINALRRHASETVAEPTALGQKPPTEPAIAWIDRYAALQNEFRESLTHRYGRQHRSDELIGHAVDGSIKLLDAITLAECVASERPARILEVGSFLGFSTRWLLEVSGSIGAGGSSVVSLDPRVRHRIFDDIKSHVVSFCAGHGDRLSCVDACLSDRNDEMFLYDYLNYEPKLTRDDALRLLAGVPVLREPFDRFDMAFVDGDHGFAATVFNVHLVASMLPAGGLVVVHDAISWPEVAPALRALCARERGSGLRLESIAGSHFQARFGREPSLKRLTDGLGLVRVMDPAAVRGFDPACVLKRG